MTHNFFEKYFMIPAVNFYFLFKACTCTNKKAFTVISRLIFTLIFKKLIDFI